MVCSNVDDRYRGKKEHVSPSIDKLDGEDLLQLARTAIEQYLNDDIVPDRRDNDRSKPLVSGLFVTLWTSEPPFPSSTPTENLILRGCIGHVRTNLPLYDCVQEVAISAATRDPRFPPLTYAELKNIRIEIAILSPLRTVTELHQINIGQDGLMIEGLGKRGLLLPKVAIRMGWDQSSFLDGVCRKAGLPLGCWPKSCNLFAFTTIVFDEGLTDNH